MPTVASIFDALEGVKSISDDLRAPYQTVYSWKAKGFIPVWRRPAILEMARRKCAPLPLEAITYLSAIGAE